MTTLFISDIHLHDSRPHITRAFFEFLHTQAKYAETLYILGDFFDVWVGDDDDAPINAEVAAEVKAVADTGTQVFLMHGNRDFVIGKDYAAQCGAQLIAENTVIDLYGVPTLISHGDDLCTADVEYIAFRNQVRNVQWQQQMLAHPLAARRALAAQIRANSDSVNTLKSENIMDVTQDEVVRVMSEANVTRMIHGHTHRPALHPLIINGKNAERYVLGDWHEKAWAIRADQHTFELFNWDIQ